MTMAPAAIFVWRVRLLLLAMAIGLSAFNAERSPVRQIEAVEAIAPQPSRERPLEAAPALRARSGDTLVAGTGLVTGAAPALGKLGVTKLVAPPATRASCWDRSSSRSRQLQASTPSRQCKSASNRASTRSAAAVHKQKFSSVRSLKKHAKLAPAPKAGSSAVIRISAKGNASKATTVTAAKPRQGSSSRANS